jgi:hypothetical protein
MQGKELRQVKANQCKAPMQGKTSHLGKATR